MGYITEQEVILANLKSNSMDTLNQALRDLIGEHDPVVKKIKEMRDLYKGEHQILKDEKVGTRPDIRLVFNFAKKVVHWAKRYLLGKAHTYKLEIPEKDREYKETKQFLDEILWPIFRENDEDVLLRDIFTNMLIDRRSWELVYVGEGVYPHNIKLKSLTDDEFIPIYNASKTDQLDAGVRYWTETVIDEPDGEPKERIRVEFYDKSMVTNYIENDQGEFVEDPERPPYPHLFEEVPIIEYLHPDKQSDVEGIKSLIDDYNLQRSSRAQDLNYSAFSYLWLHNVLFGVEQNDSLSLAQKEQKVKEYLASRILQTFDPEDFSGEQSKSLKGMIQFIEKTLPVEPLTDHLGDLRKAIHEFTSTPNIDGDSNLSNVAEATLRLMFLPADMKADDMEPVLRKGIRKRIRLISQLVYKATGKRYNPLWIGVEFKRNRIINETEIVTALGTARTAGIMSRDAAVEKNPMVDDPDMEKTRLEEEEREKAKRLLNGFDFNAHGSQDDKDPNDGVEFVKEKDDA